MTALELLTHDGCPCTPTMQASLLDALRSFRGWWTYRLVAQQTLSPPTSAGGIQRPPCFTKVATFSACGQSYTSAA